MEYKTCKFTIGQLIHHYRFDYRGVIFDIDPTFEGSDEWYDLMARSLPPKDQPWYHVLVHGADHTTYVAERNLELDITQEPIKHPLLLEYFEEYKKGHYIQKMN